MDRLDLTTLPTAELHVHLEGTLEPETVLALAERNRVDLPWSDADALRQAYRFSCLQDFLDLYYATMATLRTAEDFHTMAMAYYRRAAAQGVVHVEAFVDPQAHLVRGVPYEEVMAGLWRARADAEAELGITGGLIACLLRDRPLAECEEAYGLVAHDERVMGLGLDSAEAGHPPADFAAIYARAAADGKHLVAHAGEEGPSSYVTDALDLLHVERIDHGVRCAEDTALVERLARERVGLTVCPLSNRALQVTPDLADHPILALLEAGVLVTVNSDDPAFFGGYMADNFSALREVGMTDAQAVALARNSVEASFAPATRKVEILARLDGLSRSTHPA